MTETELKYYLDTSIWMDLYEDRRGYNNEPLGEFALKLVSFIKVKSLKLILTDLLIQELEANYSIEEINGMFKPFEKIIEKVIINPQQREEAKQIALKRNFPPGDVLHAIIARDTKAVLVTRDKHFNQLVDISKYYRPEELI